MRYLIALLVLSGCTNYSKLSPSNHDLAAERVADFADVDFAGRDLTGVDFTVPLEHDASVAEDMVKPDDMAAPCIASLANIGAANFAISFRITTTAQTASTIAYQRPDCNEPTEDFWEMTMDAVGFFNFGSGNPAPAPVYETNGTSFTTTVSVNDGNLHDVVFTRVNNLLSVTVDGASATPSAKEPTPVVFHALSTLGIASGDPCGAATLTGTITNFCLQTF